MALDLIHLANKLTDKEFAEIVISSGDFFPGFYRFTIGTRNYESGSLSVSGLSKAFLEQLTTGKKYNREQWTSYTKQRHRALDPRNASRSDNAIYDLLDEGYLKWMTQSSCYDIAVIEIDSGINKIVKDQTYFFMGSLIRFSNGKLILGFDFLRNKKTLNVSVDIDGLIEFTYKIYGENLKDFFLPADIIASLSFVDDIGTLELTDQSFSRLTIADGNSVLIASNRDFSKDIPIRWAKDIILTEVA